MKRRIALTLGSWLVLAVLLAPGGVSAAEDRVAFLAEKLRDPSSFKARLKAAVLLGRLADSRAVGPLSRALNDENYVVRGAAARALGNLGHPIAVAAVEPLLDMVGDEEQFVRKEVRRALKRLAGEKSLDYFIAALSNEDPRVRMTSVRVLSSMDMPEARWAIIPAMGDADEEVKAEAIIAVRGLGQDELDEVIKMALAKKENYKIQVTAARLAGEMKISSTVEKLASLLVRDDVVPEVKREASNALAQMKDEIEVKQLVSQLESEDQSARDLAIKLLGIHGGQEAVDALLVLLRNDDPFVRRRAITALGVAGEPRAIKPLEYLLQNEQSPRIREQIQRTLRRLEPR